MFGILNTIILSFVICIDSFVLCFLNKSTSKLHYFLIPLIFSTFQAIFLITGYFLGDFIDEYLQNYVKYTLFIIFSTVAVKLIIDTLLNKGKEKTCPSALLHIILQALTTSFDSLFLGVPFAFANLDYSTLAVIVFIITFTVCLLALLLRNKIKKNYDDKISIIGSIILFIFAFKSLI